MTEDRIKEGYKEHLQKDIHLAHDPQYCFECGRSISGRPVTIEWEKDSVRWIWQYCQVEHTPQPDDYPDPPDEASRVIDTSF